MSDDAAQDGEPAKPPIVTQADLRQWERDAKSGKVYSATSELRLMRLIAALRAGTLEGVAVMHQNGGTA